MEKIIKLHSRGGIENYLKMMKKPDGEESKTYLLKTSMPTPRIGYVDDKYKFIDPSGGPMIVEGSLLEEANAKVKSIDFVTGFGHTVTFE